MKISPLGIAIIGTGRAGLIHAGNFSRSVPGARLVALADPVAESLAQARETLNVELGFADYRAVLERSDVQAVVIATPTAFHREIAIAAARAGKHVLCEKPMAMNVAECDAIIAAAGSAGIVLQIAFLVALQAAIWRA